MCLIRHRQRGVEVESGTVAEVPDVVLLLSRKLCDETDKKRERQHYIAHNISPEKNQYQWVALGAGER